MTAGPMKVLAELFELVEAETAFGGRSVSREFLGYAWLKLGARRRRERREAGGVRDVETLAAEARSDARLSIGRVLRFRGAEWLIEAGETVGGRSILMLERMR